MNLPCWYSQTLQADSGIWRSGTGFWAGAGFRSVCSSVMAGPEVGMRQPVCASSLTSSRQHTQGCIPQLPAWHRQEARRLQVVWAECLHLSLQLPGSPADFSQALTPFPAMGQRPRLRHSGQSVAQLPVSGNIRRVCSRLAWLAFL